MSLVPQIIFAGSGIIVAGIGVAVRNDPRRGQATPFLILLGIVLVGLAIVVTLAG